MFALNYLRYENRQLLCLEPRSFLEFSEVVSAQCFKREVSLLTLSLLPTTKSKNQER